MSVVGERSTEAPASRIQRWLRVLWRSRAFLRRDLLFETSYKLQSLFRMSNVFIQIMAFYFLARVFEGAGEREHLEAYGGDYFTYVLVGLAFVGFLNAGLMSFTVAIRQQMSVGVFEYMAATPIGNASLLSYSLLWPLAFEVLKSAVYLIVGTLVLSAKLEIVNLLGLLLTLSLSFAVFGGLGVIAASIIIYVKRGDPVAWFMSAMSTLVGGILFPISVLPDSLKALAHVLPYPYAVDAFRGCLIPAARGIDVSENLWILSQFALVLVPLAWGVAQLSFLAARRDGSLAQY